MSLYAIALFLHIVGALGLFAALGLEWTSLRQLRRATTVAQARAWFDVLGLVRRIGPAALATILLPGFYLMATAWSWTGWIVVALAGMGVLAVLGALNGVPLSALGRELATQQGALTAPVRERLQHPRFVLSIQTRVALVLGIVFLMTVKPDLGGALLTIGVAVVLGLVTSVPAWRRERARRVPAVAVGDDAAA